MVDYKRSNLAPKAGGEVTTTASPYLTDERLEIQATARRFAMDEVLPLANELDKQKADIPRRLPEAHRRDAATSGS